MKNLKKLGKALSKVEQKQIIGGLLGKDPCPCTSNYTVEGSAGECSYPALFPQGFRCWGHVENGICCES